MPHQTSIKNDEDNQLNNTSDLDADGGPVPSTSVTQPITLNSASTANNSSAGDVCRDYLRNACRRINCKFAHPEGVNSNVDMSSNIKPPQLTFCFDYQNRECRRANCKYIHCTKQEEGVYKATGKLPSAANNANNSINAPSTSSTSNGYASSQGPMTSASVSNSVANYTPKYQYTAPPPPSIPAYQTNDCTETHPSQQPYMCKDFLKGECYRGSRCKFRHYDSSSRSDHYKTNNFSQESYYGHPADAPSSYYSTAPPVAPAPPQPETTYNPPVRTYETMKAPAATYSMPNVLLDHRATSRSAFEPDPKRRAYDNGYNAPTTFNYSAPAAVSASLNAATITAQPQQPTVSGHSDGNSAATAAAAAAVAAAAALNEFNGASVATSAAAAANTITRSMYSNISDSRYLLEENQALRRRVDELTKQTSELIAANDYLIEQNAQLRSISGMPAVTSCPASSTAVSSASVGNPVVATPSQAAAIQLATTTSLQQSQQQQQQQQRAAAAAAAAVAAAAAAAGSADVPASLAGSLGAAAAVAAAAASSAPRAAAAQSVAVPAVSVSASNLAAAAASSIAALTTSVSSTPLVSYPIMTPNIQYNVKNELGLH